MLSKISCLLWNNTSMYVCECLLKLSNTTKEKLKWNKRGLSKFLQLQIPITSYLKIFVRVILPVALCGSEVWSPRCSWTHWHKQLHKSRHIQIHFTRTKKNINKCLSSRAKYPLIINIQKRALTSLSTPDILHPKPSKPKSWAQKRVPYMPVGAETKCPSQTPIGVTITLLFKQQLKWTLLWNNIKKLSQITGTKETKSQIRFVPYLPWIQYQLLSEAAAGQAHTHKTTHIQYKTRLNKECILYYHNQVNYDFTELQWMII